MPRPASSLIPPRTWTQRNAKEPTSTITITRTKNQNQKQNQEQEQEYFFVSTDPRFLSAKAVNAAFARDFVYWAHPLPEEVMQQMLDGSLCFGVYKYRHKYRNRHSLDTTTTSSLPGQGHGDDDEEEKFDVTTLLHPANSNDIEQIEQIGLARLITDTVTFAYLTDVYILPEYQGRGLGAWMMDCVAETLSSANMPHLRRTMLVTTNRALDGGRREDYYAAKFGMRVVGTERREDLGGSTSSSSGDGGGSGMVLSVMSASRRKVATTGDEDKEGAS
ncbi:hypothetical protein VTN96DRAFT_6988 [Rasamsonia emersonii]